MNKTKLILVFFAGFIFGVVATIKLFAIEDIDILSLPYKNHGVMLQEQLEIVQNGNNLILPKGLELNVLYETSEGLTNYAIPVVIEPFQDLKTSYLKERASYFVKQKLSKD